MLDDKSHITQIIVLFNSDTTVIGGIQRPKPMSVA